MQTYHGATHRLVGRDNCERWFASSIEDALWHMQLTTMAPFAHGAVLPSQSVLLIEPAHSHERRLASWRVAVTG